jgi:N-acetylglucosaminyldiphosphoundecaprenol N-acetyl-beta-D-mannosaminyltransferase
MGVRVGAVSEADAVRAIVSAAAANRGCWAITANLDHLRRYQQESAARELIDSADLVVADGAPLIWASRIAGDPLPERVAGSTMMWAICEAAGHHQLPVFLLGGDPGVAERAAQILLDRYTGLKIAGVSCPPMGFENHGHELDRIRDEVADANPQIVLVALGFPKQDVLIRYLRDTLPAVSFIGVGIGLSFISGQKARAPNWVQKSGLEWVHRLLQEPRRLGRRYLFQGAPFALRLLMSAAWHRLHGRSSGSRWGYETADGVRRRQGADPLERRAIDVV